ncbi:vicilin-like seed storage protein At2g18540 [Ischnura elegans]|uniref:vicilin-like seed storage protein At2g18540 n=1 Tax=Ischnura elegans TaxID=197161 RepID=UPI001ED89157|nr:vicilin-like seed storage protein At2g18540 [Ischnura elegans]
MAYQPDSWDIKLSPKENYAKLQINCETSAKPPLLIPKSEIEEASLMNKVNNDTESHRFLPEVLLFVDQGNARVGMNDSPIHSVINDAFCKKKKKALLMREKRMDEMYRAQERIRNTLYMRDRRKDEAFRIQERARNALYMRRRRQDEEYRRMEKERNALIMQKRRQNEEFRNKERARNAELMREKRKDEEFRREERQRNAMYVRNKRQNEAAKANNSNNNEVRTLKVENPENREEVPLSLVRQDAPNAAHVQHPYGEIFSEYQMV